MVGENTATGAGAATGAVDGVRRGGEMEDTKE